MLNHLAKNPILSIIPETAPVVTKRITHSIERIMGIRRHLPTLVSPEHKRMAKDELREDLSMPISG